MSWETFVVSTLEIAPGVSEEKKAKIIENFEEVLETDLIWDDQAKGLPKNNLAKFII